MVMLEDWSNSKRESNGNEIFLESIAIFTRCMLETHIQECAWHAQEINIFPAAAGF